MLSKQAVTYTIESPDSPEALGLMDCLNQELSGLYPGKSIHAFSDDEIRYWKGIFIVVRRDATPIGCGAVRPLAPKVGEVKRMFVDPKFRGRGIGKAILLRLEEESRKAGYTMLKLESGIRQPAAVSLYENMGYTAIPPYNELVSTPVSLCYEKQLGQTDSSQRAP